MHTANLGGWSDLIRKIKKLNLIKIFDSSKFCLIGLFAWVFYWLQIENNAMNELICPLKMYSENDRAFRYEIWEDKHYLFGI